MNASMQKVAFFDIDGTVFRSSLLIELVTQLVEAGVFPKSAGEEYQAAYQEWKNREGSYEEYIHAVIATYIHHIKGVYYGDVADIGRTLVGVHSKHVYRYTRDLIKTLKAEGYYIVAISQSPKSILDEFCATYGFDKVYGRMYEIGPTDKFTGVVIDEHIIENKANVIDRVFSKGTFDLRDSIGVGDTEGDISMLEEVAIPICFNPNKALYAQAKLKGWKVVVERKDVIYEL